MRSVFSFVQWKKNSKYFTTSILLCLCDVRTCLNAKVYSPCPPLKSPSSLHPPPVCGLHHSVEHQQRASYQLVLFLNTNTEIPKHKYNIKIEILKPISFLRRGPLKVWKTIGGKIWTKKEWKENNLPKYNLKLDPVGSTVRYEMMKLCTGSV